MIPDPPSDVIAVGIDLAEGHDPDVRMVVVRGVHYRIDLDCLPRDPLPFCWVAQTRQAGEPDDLWAISVDHETLPGYYLTSDRDRVSCDDCREWLHG